jgi:hypothetical protein
MKTKKYKDLTAEQYRRLITLPEDYQAIDIIAALELTHPDKLPIQTIKAYKTQDLSPSLLPSSTNHPHLPLIFHNGTLYGQVPMDTLTFGEFIDISEMGKDVQANLISLMTILWRPITKITLLNKAKITLALMLFRKGLHSWAHRILNTTKYLTEEYDALKADTRHKEYKTFPAPIAHQTLVFIHHFSQLRQADILHSMGTQNPMSPREVNP